MSAVTNQQTDEDGRYREFVTDDYEIVVYDTENPDAWLLSDLRKVVMP